MPPLLLAKTAPKYTAIITGVMKAHMAWAEMNEPTTAMLMHKTKMGTVKPLVQPNSQAASLLCRPTSTTATPMAKTPKRNMGASPAKLLPISFMGRRWRK